MKTKYFKYFFFLALLLAALPAWTKVFVNWRAGYYITYPDDWYHVPYSTVNIFLTSQNVSQLEFDYDAVLAQQSDKPFFDVPYLFLTFLPVGELDNRQMDSAVEAFSREYGRDYTEGSLAQDRGFNLRRPVYDRSLKAVAVKSRITSETTDKILLEMRKFYEKGIAIFLFYAPKDLYNAARPKFITIFNSFSTSDLEAAAPRDSIKIVDPSQRDLNQYNESEFPEPGQKQEEGENPKKIVYVIILVALVAAVITYFIITRRK
jgi:hypothetical protein